MEENYCALCVSILTGCTPEEAFKKLEKKIVKKVSHTRINHTREEVQAMYEYRLKGLNNRQVGELFGIDMYQVAKRISYYIRKNGLPLAGPLRR